ncbi:MAG: hypothetical protein M3O87_04120 [Candidatus Dormibacteraeota bacterium]|nr:hypothetical protein [Candidatus Dormibacteraeota bacterium]
MKGDRERHRRAAVDVAGDGPTYALSGLHAELLEAAANKMGQDPAWLLQQLVASYLVRAGFALAPHGNSNQPRPPR